MNLERFQRERRPAWDELGAAIKRARGRPERLDPDGVRRLASLYREATADLALARRRFPRDPLVPYLEDLVTRARGLVYGQDRREGSLRFFLATGYWRRIAQRPTLLLVAAALLFAPAIAATLWAVEDPARAIGIVPDHFQGGNEGGGALGDIGTDEQAVFSALIFTNNIQVSFLAFAGGIAAGLGTAAVLVYNGIFLGSVTGLVVGAGEGARFVSLVAPHGVLELSCIVVVAAAGLRLGWAVVEPGPYSRGAALSKEARPAVEIVLGTLPWLVVAGVIEGFVTPEELPVVPAVLVGIASGGVFWALVVARGRPAGSEPSA